MQLTPKYSFAATVMNMQPIPFYFTQLQWERALGHVAMEITAVKIKTQEGVCCWFFNDRVGEHAITGWNQIPSSLLSPPRKDEVKEKKTRRQKNTGGRLWLEWTAD